MKELGYEQSMSRRGNCWDNSSQESYFGHMKDECDFSKCSTPEDEYMEIEQEKYDKMMEKAGIKALKRAVELGAFTQEKLELWLK